MRLVRFRSIRRVRMFFRWAARYGFPSVAALLIRLVWVLWILGVSWERLRADIREVRRMQRKGLL